MQHHWTYIWLLKMNVKATTPQVNSETYGRFFYSVLCDFANCAYERAFNGDFAA